MKREYIECECGTPEHTLRFTWEDGPDWPEIYVEVHLDHHYGIFKRIWYGIRYIFGFKSVYGQFDEATLSYDKVKQLKTLCERWMKTHQKAPATLEEKINVSELAVKVFKRKVEEEKKELARLREELVSITDGDD